MNIQISNVNIKYNGDLVEKVHIYFVGRSEDGSLSVNGNISLTADEYEGNESISGMTELAKQHIIEKVTYVAPVEEETEEEV